LGVIRYSRQKEAARMPSLPESQLTQKIVYPGLSHWADAFYRSKASEGLSRRTLEFYRYLLGQFCDYLLAHGIIEVEKIIPDDIRGYFLSLEDLWNKN
jgi:hypothetical protein